MNITFGSEHISYSTPIIFFALGVVLFLFLRIINVYRGKNNFKRLIAILSTSADDALKMLSSVFVPTRLISDEETHRALSKYDGLVSEISALCQHKYFDLDTFQSSKAGQLMHFIEGIKGYQDETNTVYKTIEDLKATAALVMGQYREYTNPAHYFAYSEMEEFLSFSASVKEKIALVFPKYAEYIDNEDAAALPSLAIQRQTAQRNLRRNISF